MAFIRSLILSIQSSAFFHASILNHSVNQYFTLKRSANADATYVAEDMELQVRLHEGAAGSSNWNFDRMKTSADPRSTAEFQDDAALQAEGFKSVPNLLLLFA